MEADREAVGQVCRAALDLKQLAKQCVFGGTGGVRDLERDSWRLCRDNQG